MENEEERDGMEFGTLRDGTSNAASGENLVASCWGNERYGGLAWSLGLSSIIIIILM